MVSQTGNSTSHFISHNDTNKSLDISTGQRCFSTTCKNLTSDSAAYAGDGKTVVRVLNAEESPLNLVNTYSARGFRLNNHIFITGSILLFPTNVFAWNVQRGKDITADSLILFDLIVPKVKIVIIGYGQKGEPYDASLPMKLKKKGISCEILPTPNAVTTYNYLVNDSVHAAGAFVPTKQDVGMTERDYEATFGYDKIFGDLAHLNEETPSSREDMFYAKQRYDIMNKDDKDGKTKFD